MDEAPPRIPAHTPLAGIRVLDFSRYLPGPFCTLHLAWLGAEVTCIEQPPHGDPMRAIPPLDGDGVGLAYRSLRREAACELLDLGSEPGCERARELALAADVVVESFRPGVAERLGIGPLALRERDPRLIYCSLSGYGQTGPWAQAPGHDLTYEAIAGLLEQTGTPDQVVVPPVPLADLTGGVTAAAAICAALVRRATTGEGCTLDLSLTEAALSLHAMHLPASRAPDNARGTGMLTGGLASYDSYECADGAWLAVAPIEPKFFTQLCEVLALPDLIELQYDLQAQERIRTELATHFATAPATHWEELLTGADGGSSCVARALHPSEVAHHPQLLARDALCTLNAGTHMPASPYVVDGVRNRR